MKKRIRLSALLAKTDGLTTEIEKEKGTWFLNHLYKWDAALTEKSRRVMEHIKILKENNRASKLIKNQYYLGLERKYTMLSNQCSLIMEQKEKLIKILSLSNLYGVKS